MRTFIIIWLGQFVSTIGSIMTGFAIEIWVWEQTQQATTLTLWSFFTLLPSILIFPIAGIIVDSPSETLGERWRRKYLMIVGDTVTVLTTIAFLLLYTSANLHIWQLYLIGAIAGAFQQVQELAYSASITLMVPQHQYVRVSGLRALSGRFSQIIAPPLAGFLYYAIGVAGIAVIDIITFGVAIATVLFVTIPQPSHNSKSVSLTQWQELQFGIRYILNDRSLLALLMINLLFWLPHDIGDSLYSPLILSRTQNDARILGSTAVAAGLGGVTGALLISTWGGPRQRINGVLCGMIGAGISKIVFGLGRFSQVWLPAQFCSSVNFPILSSCDTAIWMTKVEPEIQGKVFAAQSLVLQMVSAIAVLLAGPLADKVFEPAAQSQHFIARFLGTIFGTSAGSGIAFLYVLCAVCMFLVGCVGYAVPILRKLDTR
ncbi:major facilitator superfamily MFS_1 [Gloeocapsa sp. PCC 7428]|uniref:MFS transporter n=1 Tax=Gloeocapsa sp. PCC 7428 TaxID=1173026 RepID=UPI0002A6001F|nr:MFS transporter [Gloeocapsa sp. PCC 7428]AFZ29291.1 major facilitator superfamily MFS_1 [Gloeocapsa sp. PCC 7428]